MSVGLVDAGEIDTRQEKHSWGHIGVLFAAVDLEAVNPVLVDRVAGSEDGGVPVGHHDVVIVGQTVAAGVIAEALLSLLELLQELKVTWD